MFPDKDCIKELKIYNQHFAILLTRLMDDNPILSRERNSHRVVNEDSEG